MRYFKYYNIIVLCLIVLMTSCVSKKYSTDIFFTKVDDKNVQYLYFNNYDSSYTEKYIYITGEIRDSINGYYEIKDSLIILKSNFYLNNPKWISKIISIPRYSCSVLDTLYIYSYDKIGYVKNFDSINYLQKIK
jgi:hypothetical protein